MSAEDDLVSQLAAEALRLAGQRELRATGLLWYDNMLGILKDTITGSSNAKKAQRLAQLAAGNRDALYEADKIDRRPWREH